MKLIKIKSIKAISNNSKRYDIEVNNNNNFFANNVLIHNSLGILFFYNNKWIISTRGSFHSEQADKANQILKNKYANILDKLNVNNTYLFEILYRENRIVCDYGDLEDLILLAIIDNETGLDLPLDIDYFPIVKSIKVDELSVSSLKSLEESNKEGFVVKFESGFRFKIKFEEYKRLHRILTNISEKSILEILQNGDDLNVLLNDVPDEFYNWVKRTEIAFKQQYDEIDTYIDEHYKVLTTRKETAEYYKSLMYPSLFFLKLDGKDYKSKIWMHVKCKISDVE